MNILLPVVTILAMAGLAYAGLLLVLHIDLKDVKQLFKEALWQARENYHYWRHKIE